MRVVWLCALHGQLNSSDDAGSNFGCTGRGQTLDVFMTPDTPRIPHMSRSAPGRPMTSSSTSCTIPTQPCVSRFVRCLHVYLTLRLYTLYFMPYTLCVCITPCSPLGARAEIESRGICILFDARFTDLHEHLRRTPPALCRRTFSWAPK